jgi:thymidylate synthase
LSKEYIDLCKRVISDGEWVFNERTGKNCLTVIDASFEYDVSQGHLPALTTKKAYWKPAINEILGYLRGYKNSSQFTEIGCNTWQANTNKNESWLANPHRKGEGDMGMAYQMREPNNDQLLKVYNNLREGIDDRGEVITFWKSDDFYRSCLRPCMHTHTFSILNGTLYLTSYQRSDDIPLGHGFNQIQVAWFLMIMAQITGLKAGKAFHKIVNVHIYENQLDGIKEQITREPYPAPILLINPKIKTLNDLETWVTTDDFELIGYEHHPAIKYKFAV